HPPFRYLNEVLAHHAIFDSSIPQRRDRPEPPAECQFWDVLEARWRLEPSARPKMSDLILHR
ncbi:hypothetical protein FRB96_009458, partial [Tulasnella sp. 330]